MKIPLIFITILLFSSTLFSQAESFAEAKLISAEKDQPILMVFSGSDWCKPCIHLKKQVLDQAAFNSYAADNLVLLEVDFPYRKQNRLSKEKQAANDALAEQYNPTGNFPTVLLVSATGEVIGNIKSRTSREFIQEIKIIGAAKI